MVRIDTTLGWYNKKAGLFVREYKYNKLIGNNITLLTLVELSPTNDRSREFYADVFHLKSYAELFVCT